MDIKRHMARLVGTNAQMDGIAALMTADIEGVRKKKDERDTEFVKRIARTYNSIALKNMLANTGERDE